MNLPEEHKNMAKKTTIMQLSSKM